MSGASTLSAYLVELVKQQSDNRVEFKSSVLGGIGCFALEPLTAGDVLFRVPRNIILSASCPGVCNNPPIKLLAQESQVTSESLLCVHVALEAKAGTNEYINTLTPLVELDAGELSGTNVGGQVTVDVGELEGQLLLIQKVIPDLTLTEFMTAKRQYNSRRYPARFALSVGDDEGSVKGRKRRREDPVAPSPNGLAPVPRRLFDLTEGCFCPLLDILNHSSFHGEHPLAYDVESENLVVRITVDYERGDEIYSNYGCRNNDSFLLQFGFCDPDPTMDAVLVKVAGGDSVFELRPHCIPDSLLGDGGEGLYHLLSKKYDMLPSRKFPPSDNPAVVQYMSRQRKLLKILIRELEEMCSEGESSD